ncbi:MAG: DUF418 domain-containing protein [Spirochaetaceae bacterium]|nr:MAG: DUF418 domain-containing protein [Spirochaetaceae bacterium]
MRVRAMQETVNETLGTGLRPTQPNERVFAIDAVRGTAILGILVVNMMFFAWPFYKILTVGSFSGAGTIDRIAELAIWFFAESKFITMFSLLFGFGFSMLMVRAEKAGRSPARLFSRRLFVLLLIGLVHTILFWIHDVLVYFALTGFLLLLFRNRTNRTLLRWAVVFLALPVLFALIMTTLNTVVWTSPEAVAEFESGVTAQREMFEDFYAQAMTVYSSGTFLEITTQRVFDFIMEFIGGFLAGSVFLIMAMFLIGTVIGRRGMLQNPSAHLDSWRKLLRTAAPIGIIGSAVYTWAHAMTVPLALNWPSFFQTLGVYVGGPALSLAYVACIVLFVQSESGKRLFTPVAAVGRYALSNYLFQSVVCTTLFYGYGFGLFGQVRPALGLLLTLVIFSIQMGLSMLLVRRFRYGPAEWVWRKLTYQAL